MYTVRIWIESFITWLQMLKRNENTILSVVKFGRMLVPIVVRKVRFAYTYFHFVHLIIHPSIPPLPCFPWASCRGNRYLSVSGSSPCRTCLENIQSDVHMRQHNQLIKPPHLSLFDVEQQQLYCKRTSPYLEG